MEVATLNKEKTVVRVGQKQYNVQCKQPQQINSGKVCTPHLT